MSLHSLLLRRRFNTAVRDGGLGDSSGVFDGFPGQTLRHPRLPQKNETMGTRGTHGTNYLSLRNQRVAKDDPTPRMFPVEHFSPNRAPGRRTFVTQPAVPQTFPSHPMVECGDQVSAEVPGNCRLKPQTRRHVHRSFLQKFRGARTVAPKIHSGGQRNLGPDLEGRLPAFPSGSSVCFKSERM